MLEIGPGRGAITRQLLALGHAVVAVEIDAGLGEEVRGLGEGVRVVHGSILDFSPSALLPQPSWVVGALPYHLSGAILRWLADHAEEVLGACFILQEEVVARMAAPPGDRARGLLSVVLQSVFHVEPGFRIPPGAFSPPPRVSSRSVVLTRLETTLSQVQPLWEVARELFRQPRRMVRSSIGRTWGREGLAAAGKLDMDLTVRPSCLTLAQLQALTAALGGVAPVLPPHQPNPREDNRLTA